MALVYVANSGEDTVSVLCTERLYEIDRIKLQGCGPMGPRRLAYDQMTKSLYCINSYANTVCRVLGEASKHVPVGAYPTDICIGGSMVYVCCGESDGIWGMDRKTLQKKIFAPSGMFPHSICINNSTIATANLVSCDVTVFHDTLEPAGSLEIDGNPLCVAICGEEKYLVAHTGQEYSELGWVSIFEGGELADKLQVGPMPSTIAFVEGTILIVNFGTTYLSAFDIETNKSLGNIELGGMPDYICYDAESGNAFVSCMTDNTVKVLSPELKVVRSISVGQEPRGMTLG